MTNVPQKSGAWAKQQEALLGRKARRSKSPLEFIEQVLQFVAKECQAERGVLYLFDDDAPSLNSIWKRQLELDTQSELVATASWGFPDPAEIVHRLFLSTTLRSRAVSELKRALPSLGYPTVETIPFFSKESKIGGIIAIYSHLSSEAVLKIRDRLKSVLSETSIIVDFVVDRFLQQELVSLNQFGLKSVSFDSQDGMCRIIEETRKLLGCEGISFFVRDTTTDDEAFWLTAASPGAMPTTPVGYTPKDNNFTARALTHKKPSIIHDVQEVRRRIGGLNPPKWCELSKGAVDHSLLFVPVVRGDHIVALLRCTNKIKAAGEALFNRLDVRRAEAFAALLHTWQSAVENEAHFTSSLLDIAHELRLSAAGIKARAEYVDIVIGRRNLEVELVRKKLGDIVLSMDSILEMMALVVALPSGGDAAVTQLNAAPFKPYADLCIPVVNSYKQQADKRGLKFSFRNEYQMGLIYADLRDFLPILRNLVGNAVKYTNLGKEVFIVLDPPRQQSRYAAIRVISESLPIRPDEREQIFRFRYRALSARESGTEGHGRGLAIARGKARRFNGDLVHTYLPNMTNMNVFSLLIPKALFRPPNLQ